MSTSKADIYRPESGTNLKDLHRVLTAFAKEIDAFCTEYGITYYLMGGTALGAIRHKGFIPWDDDFDIFMDRENYLRFIMRAKESLDKEKFYVQTEDTEEWPLFFSKIRLNNTLYIERSDDHRKMHTGIFIDVMCLHNVYDHRWKRYLQFISARVLSAMALSHRGYSTKSMAKRVAISTAKILRHTPLKQLLLMFVRSLDHKKTNLVGHFFGRAPFKSTTFPRDFLGAPRRIPFEGVHLPVPGNVEGYLSTRFGSNYMMMPNEETRNSFPSHLKSFDLGPYA